MDKPFPFDVAYKHIAHQIMVRGLPRNSILEPTVTLIHVKNGSVVKAQEAPDMARMFDTNQGKATIGRFIGAVVNGPRLPDGYDFCVVVATEAYTIMAEANEKSVSEVAAALKAGMKGGISDHPDAIEVVSIMVHHRTGSKAGFLNINSDRSLTYQPLQEGVGVGGRLSPTGED